MIGEMCPAAAAGRPAVAPLVMRGVTWTDKPDELSSTVEHGATPRYVVLGTSGKRAGVFDTVGLEEAAAAGGAPIASGAYTGAGPCSIDDGKGGKADNPQCALATGGCGLAIADIVRTDDPPETPNVTAADVCLVENALVVDIDGDKVMEAFPLDQVLDGIRGPAAEWTASPTAGAPCAAGKASAQLYGIPIEARGAKDGKADPKATVTVNVLGALDLDGDGRKEIVLLVQFPTVRTLVVYSAVDMAQRLELVGEGAALVTPPM